VTEVRIKTFQLRAELADILDRVQNHNTRATIMRYGVPIAYVVSIDTITELDQLRKLYRTTVSMEVTKDKVVRYVQPSSVVQEPIKV
jgi:prevent-host-death family protein